MDDIDWVVAEAEQDQVGAVQCASQVRGKVCAEWKGKRAFGNFKKPCVKFIDKAVRPFRIIARDIFTDPANFAGGLTRNAEFHAASSFLCCSTSVATCVRSSSKNSSPSMNGPAIPLALSARNYASAMERRSCSSLPSRKASRKH